MARNSALCTFVLEDLWIEVGRTKVWTCYR